MFKHFLGSLALLFLLACVAAGTLLLPGSGDEQFLEERARYMPTAGETGENEALAQLEEEWHNRVTYPTGLFNPEWLRLAALRDALIPRAVPGGIKALPPTYGAEGAGASPYSFVSLGPQPLRMTGCSGCYNYSLTSGRVNAIVVDPRTTTNGSIVAYAATDGGGVWKTTNCCSSATGANPTTWTVVTDDPLISTTAIDTLALDPNDPDTIYAGTGDLNYGSFSFGSQGILKSTDGGTTWTVLGSDVFGPALPQPAGQFPQYEAVGKVRVDPNDSNIVAAGTKRGLFLSYDAGASWTGPCATNAFATQRQDLTGLELSDIGGTTRIVAAVGVRGFATPVQYNLDQNGANGIYAATMPATGCPVFASITSNTNGWLGQNATSGNNYAAGATGNKLGRIDIAVAPSDPNYIYAQVQSIAPNSNGGCGNAPGCQLAAWRTIDGGVTWTQIPGSTGAALRNCSNGAGDYAQNWYDQGVAVDPNDPNRAFFDTYEIFFWQDGSSTWQDTTCGYSGSTQVVHVDQHALAFVPGSSSILLAGNDGGVHATTNANVANGSTRPTWFNMGKGLNTIEFYAGDISANFLTSARPMANGGAQDNGSMTVAFNGYPTGPAQWQMGMGGDGFYARIDPVGNRFWQGNNGGSLNYCDHAPPASDCTTPADWLPDSSPWQNAGDIMSFILPYEIFKGTPDSPASDCPPNGCGHLIVGTTRVWETTTAGNAWAPVSGDLVKGTLGNRSFINQLAFEPRDQSRAIVGTNDGNVQYGHSPAVGGGIALWVDLTGGNTVLPNRPILDVWFDPTTTTAPIAYAAVGGFNANTPSTPGHVFRVTCNADCATFTWADKTGNLPDIPVDSIIVNPNLPKQVFAGTDWGVYFTDDVTVASPAWARFENGLPHSMVWDMAIDRGGTTLSVWTRGRGAYVWPLPRPNAPPAATLSASPTSGIAAQAVDFTVAGSDGNSDPLTYDLDFGDGTAHGTTSGSVNHTYAAAGSYTATLTVTDTHAGTDTKTVSLTISPNTIPTVSLSPTGALVETGQPLTFTAGGSDPDAGDALTYDFDFGDGTPHGSSSGTVNHTYAASGSYTATLTVNDTHGGSATATASIVADHSPVASLAPTESTIVAGESVTFTAGGTDADTGDTLTYDIDFADGSAHGTTDGSLMHTYASAGKYLVTLTVRDSHGASDTAIASVTVDPPPAPPASIGDNSAGALGWLTLLPLLGAGIARRRRDKQDGPAVRPTHLLSQASPLPSPSASA